MLVAKQLNITTILSEIGTQVKVVLSLTSVQTLMTTPVLSPLRRSLKGEILKYLRLKALVFYNTRLEPMITSDFSIIRDL